MRLIDADAFKEYLKQGTELALKEAMLAGILTKKVEKEIDETLKGILADINEQPTVNEWIPCSERLPENSENVLVQIDNLTIIEQYIAYFDKKKEVWFTQDYTYQFGCGGHGVIAWMPLPEPYKEADGCE